MNRFVRVVPTNVKFSPEHRREHHDELDQRVAEFLARGGRITEVPSGASGLVGPDGKSKVRVPSDTNSLMGYVD